MTFFLAHILIFDISLFSLSLLGGLTPEFLLEINHSDFWLTFISTDVNSEAYKILLQARCMHASSQFIYFFYFLTVGQFYLHTSSLFMIN